MARSCRSKIWLGRGAKCWALFTQLHPKPIFLAHCPNLEPQKRLKSIIATRINVVTRQGWTYQAVFFTPKDLQEKVFLLYLTAIILKRVLLKTSWSNWCQWDCSYCSWCHSWNRTRNWNWSSWICFWESTWGYWVFCNQSFEVDDHMIFGTMTTW